MTIFEEFESLQERYSVIFFATLKAIDEEDEYITVPNELKSVVEHFAEHFTLHKDEILSMIKSNIIQRNV